MADKTIGNMNGPWAIMLKLALALMPFWIGWAVFMTHNQIKDNQFRGTGARFTADDAREQTELLMGTLNIEIAKIGQVLSQMVPASELARRDDVSLIGLELVAMQQRVSVLERNWDSIDEVEREETDILRRMQGDIADYIDWMKERDQ